VFLRAGQMADLDARRAEVLGRAARIIQRQIRTYIARKQFAELKRSATQLQSFVRGTLSSLYVEVLGKSISHVDFLFSSYINC
jgi:myosin V